MISGRFNYATTRVGFGSPFGAAGGGGSQWQKLQSNRAGIANSLAATQSALASITSALSNAQQQNIDGLATLAAKAAISRVQADAKAKAAEITKQIDGAQKTIDDAKKAGSGPMIVGNTVIQKYVSWAVTPTVDTTA